MDLLHTVVDPLFDVVEPIPKVPTCLETGRSQPPVSPYIQGCNRHAQVGRKFCRRQQSFESVHLRIMVSDPLSRMLFRCYFDVIRCLFCAVEGEDYGAALVMGGACDHARDSVNVELEGS